MAPTDRDALVALFNATDGPNWDSNTNWDTDADLSDWYGVKANDEGRVVELSLTSNNLRGPIPAELGNVKELQALLLYDNQLTGHIPKELGALSKLKKLTLEGNKLTGASPGEGSCDGSEPYVSTGADQERGDPGIPGSSGPPSNGGPSGSEPSGLAALVDWVKELLPVPTFSHEAGDSKTTPREGSCDGSEPGGSTRADRGDGDPGIPVSCGCPSNGGPTGSEHSSLSVGRPVGEVPLPNSRPTVDDTQLEPEQPPRLMYTSVEMIMPEDVHNWSPRMAAPATPSGDIDRLGPRAVDGNLLLIGYIRAIEAQIRRSSDVGGSERFTIYTLPYMVPSVEDCRRPRPPSSTSREWKKRMRSLELNLEKGEAELSELLSWERNRAMTAIALDWCGVPVEFDGEIIMRSFWHAKARWRTEGLGDIPPYVRSLFYLTEAGSGRAVAPTEYLGTHDMICGENGFQTERADIGGYISLRMGGATLVNGLIVGASEIGSPVAYLPSLWMVTRFQPGLGTVNPVVFTKLVGGDGLIRAVPVSLWNQGAVFDLRTTGLCDKVCRMHETSSRSDHAFIEGDAGTLLDGPGLSLKDAVSVLNRSGLTVYGHDGAWFGAEAGFRALALGTGVEGQAWTGQPLFLELDDQGWLPDVVLPSSTATPGWYVSTVMRALDVVSLVYVSVLIALMAGGSLDVVSFSVISTEVVAEVTSRAASTFAWAECSRVDGLKGLISAFCAPIHFTMSTYAPSNKFREWLWRTPVRVEGLAGMVSVIPITVSAGLGGRATYKALATIGGMLGLLAGANGGIMKEIFGTWGDYNCSGVYAIYGGFYVYGLGAQTLLLLQDGWSYLVVIAALSGLLEAIAALYAAWSIMHVMERDGSAEVEAKVLCKPGFRGCLTMVPKRMDDWRTESSLLAFKSCDKRGFRLVPTSDFMAADLSGLSARLFRFEDLGGERAMLALHCDGQARADQLVIMKQPYVVQSALLLDSTCATDIVKSAAPAYETDGILAVRLGAVFLPILARPPSLPR